MRPVGLLLALVACATPEVDVQDTDTGRDTDAQAPGTLVADAGPEQFALVGQRVTLDGRASVGAVEARWSLGDGTTSAVSTDLTLSHVYTAPGHYAVSLQVFDADGRQATALTRVTVSWPLPAEVPRNTSSVVVGAGRAFVAMPDFDRVAVVDLASGTVAEHLATCGSPRRLGWGPTGADQGVLAVACEEGPAGVALYEVSSAGITAGPQVDLSGTGRSPFGVVVGADGDVYVTTRARNGQAGLLVYSDGLVPRLQPTFGSDLRGLAWFDGGLMLADHRSPDAGAQWFRVDLPAWQVHTETIAPDGGADTDISHRGLPTYLQALAIRPDGRVGVMGGLKANMARGLVRDGLPLTDETTSRADLRMVALMPTDGEVGTVIGKARMDDRDLVSAVAYAPRGDWLYAATLGMQTIEVLDAYDLRGAGVFLDVGTGVDGLAVTPDGASLLAHARYDRTLVVLPLDGSFGPGVPVDLLPPEGEVFSEIVLAGARVFHTSSDVRMSRDGYTSCASCHLDGEDDRRVWDFTDRGEGLRNTISLRGMDQRMGLPIHWSGNFDEVQDFEHDIRGPQAGLGFLSDADWMGPAGTTLGAPKAGLSPELDALAAYTGSLAVLDVPVFGEVDGQAIFEDEVVGCAACHAVGAPASGWDGGQPILRDVGTLSASSGMRLGGVLEGLDVPDLAGVWATPPYLHDGSAPTLRDVVQPCEVPASGCNHADQHGVTSHLSPAELDALVLYLQRL